MLVSSLRINQQIGLPRSTYIAMLEPGYQNSAVVTSFFLGGMNRSPRVPGLLRIATTRV